MKRVLFAVLLAGAPTGVLAQQFEPYTISQQDHQALLNFLGDVPAKYANPMIGQLNQWELQAVAKKQADEAAKKVPKPSNE